MKFRVSADFLVLVVAMALLCASPKGRISQFWRDFGNLFARRPLECAESLSQPIPGPLAKRIVEYLVAMRDGARGVKSLDAATTNGRQPYLEYERHADQAFDRTVSPPQAVPDRKGSN